MQSIVKAVGIVLLMLILFVCKSQAQDNKLISVTIEIADFNIETFADVSCQEFENIFKEEKINKIFNSENDLFKFQSLKRNFIENKKSRSIDVRGFIIFRYKNNSTKYCFGTFANFYKDGSFYFNRDLLIYIMDKMYTWHHPKYLDTLRQ